MDFTVLLEQLADLILGGRERDIPDEDAFHFGSPAPDAPACKASISKTAVVGASHEIEPFDIATAIG